MKRSLIETLLGAVVLVLAGFFILTAYQSSSIASREGYLLRATFDKIDGVGVGTDVKISGIKVGSITNLHLDPATYLATIEMTINDAYQLPTDTVAVVQSEGLLGGSYLSLVPGGAEEMLKPGASIAYTQSPTSLTDLIGRFVFSATGQGKNGPGSSGSGNGANGAQPAPGGTTGGNGMDDGDSMLAPEAPAAPATPSQAAPGQAPTPQAPAPQTPDTASPDAAPTPHSEQQNGGGFGLLR